MADHEDGSAIGRILAKLKDQPKTWLVTGAAGFIGSHLTETLLRAGQRVVGLDNFATGSRENLDDIEQRVGSVLWRQFNFLEGDIVCADDCRAAAQGIDYILHQAALGSVPRSIEDPLSSHRANVDGFVNIVLAGRDAGVKRIVYASSSSVYGDSADLPKREDKTGRPLSPYAATKAIDELYARIFADVYQLSLVGLRYFNVFGPRQAPDGAYAAVIPRWIQRLINGERCAIYGDGETSRDFCYVENVVQANILAALADGVASNEAVFNIAAGGRTSLIELYRLICAELMRLAGERTYPGPDFVDFRQGDVRHSHADIGHASRVLDYKPEKNVPDGLALTVEWFFERAKQTIRPAK